MRTLETGAWFTATMLVALPGIAAAQPLGRDEVIEIARASALEVVVAERAVGESRGLRVGAEALLRQSPTLQVGAGPRFRQTDTIVDLTATLSVPLEVYGVRDAEISAADRSIETAEADVARARLEAIRNALRAYYDVLRAIEDVGWTAQQRDVARRFLDTATRRMALGDIGFADLATARILAATAAARAAVSEGEREATRALLRTALGSSVAADFEVAGRLADARGRYGSDLLSVAPRDPPELVSAELAITAARARLEAEERRAWPVPVISAQYQREEGADVAFLLAEVPLAFFQHNQRAIAQAQAELERLIAERELVAARVTGAREAARARYESSLQAVSLIETEGLPALDASLAVVQRSYELGATDLPSLLSVQRELAGARAEYLDALRRLAVAGVDLEIALGVLR